MLTQYYMTYYTEKKNYKANIVQYFIITCSFFFNTQKLFFNILQKIKLAVQISKHAVQKINRQYILKLYNAVEYLQ